jgi:hypothetical protein
MICDLDVNGDFVLLGSKGSGGKASGIDPLDPGDGGFCERALAISALPLPGPAAVSGSLCGISLALAAAMRLACVR